MSFLYNHITYLKEVEDASDHDTQAWMQAVEDLCISRKYIEILCDAFRTDIMLKFGKKIILKELWRENDDHEEGVLYDLENHSWSFFDFYSTADLEVDEVDDSRSVLTSYNTGRLSPIVEE